MMEAAWLARLKVSVHDDALKVLLCTYCPVRSATRLQLDSKSARAAHGMRLRPASSLHCSKDPSYLWTNAKGPFPQEINPLIARRIASKQAP
jgi:hypothetical protein